MAPARGKMLIWSDEISRARRRIEPFTEQTVGILKIAADHDGRNAGRQIRQFLTGDKQNKSGW